MSLGQIIQNLVCVYRDDRTITDIYGFTPTTFVVFPGIKSGAKERAHIGSPASPGLRNILLINAASIIIVEIEGNVAELTDVGRARANLALFINDKPVILLGRRIQREYRPAVFQREKATQHIVYILGAWLRLEWIHKHLGMAIQKTVRGVSAVLVHCANHQKTKVVAHFAPGFSWLNNDNEMRFPAGSCVQQHEKRSRDSHHRESNPS